MPASIWPAAILLAIRMALSSEVPQARAVVRPGVSGDSPDDSVASRARFQSAACLITAPNATSPSSTPCRPKRSTSAPNVFTAMPKLPTSAYAVLLRQNGMRTPPRMATRFVVVTMASFANGKWERCWYHAPPVVAAHCMPYVFDLDRLDRLAAARRAEFADASP